MDWRHRYQAPVVQFPSWSSDSPSQLVFVSNEGGSTQVWTVEHPIPVSGERSPTSESGSRSSSCRRTAMPWLGGVTTAATATVPGSSTSLMDGAVAPLLTGLGRGLERGSGLARRRPWRSRSPTVMRIASMSGLPAGPGRLCTSRPDLAVSGVSGRRHHGGLSTDGSLLCLRHSDAGDMLHFGLRVLDVRRRETCCAPTSSTRG